MTVLLVLFLMLALVGTDLLLRAASRWAEARRQRTQPVAPVQVPGGSFLSEGHAWVRIEADGGVRVGIDDFALIAAGPVSRVTLPEPGQAFQRGEPLFSLRTGSEELHFRAPVSGRVLEDNDELQHDARSIAQSPYDEGWICRLEPSDLGSELPSMRIGQPAASWQDKELKRLEALRASKEVVRWAELETAFLAVAR